LQWAHARDEIQPTVFLFHVLDSDNGLNDITIPGDVLGSINCTHPILLPAVETLDTPTNTPMHKIAQDFLAMTLSGTGCKLLWHQRLDHCSDEKLANAHKFTDGVPKFKSTHDVNVNYPTCSATKMKHHTRGCESARKATFPSKDFQST
jgi:hypothetical protein